MSATQLVTRLIVAVTIVLFWAVFLGLFASVPGS